MTLARLKSVAGIPIPDTTLRNAAIDLLDPDGIANHVGRTV